MKKIISLFFCGALAIVLLPLFAAHADAAPTLSIGVSGVSGTSFSVGQMWTLHLSGGPAGDPLTFCAEQSGAAVSCTPDFDTTNASGTWTLSGTFTSSTVGSWEEWATPLLGETSNHITFTVGGSGSPVVSSPIVDTGIDTNTTGCPADVQTVVQTANALMTEILDFEQSSGASVSASILAPVQQITQAVNDLVASCSTSATSNGATPVSVSNLTGSVVNPSNLTFPLTILVTSGPVNVRSAPSVSATLAGPSFYDEGDDFTATNEVTGDTVDGNDLWWVTSDGDYVWSGATEVDSSPSTNGLTPRVAVATTTAPVILSTQGYDSNTNAYETASNTMETGDDYLILYGSFSYASNTVNVNGEPLPSSALTFQGSTQINAQIGTGFDGEPFVVSVTNAAGLTSGSVNVNNAPIVTPTSGQLPASVTKTVTSNGATYSVTYSYLADGEVRALFTYKGQSYVYQPHNQNPAADLAEVQSSGSLAPANQTDLTLAALTNQISINAPANQNILPGFTFSTPLYYVDDASPYYVSAPANVFSVVGSPENSVTGLYTLMTNSNGDIIGGTPINISTQGVVTTGSGAFYLVGDAVISEQVNNFGQEVYAVLAPDLSGGSVDLKNVSVTNDASGNPSAITGQFDPVSGSYAPTPTASATASVTLRLGSLATTSTVSASGLQVVPFGNPLANGVTALVTGSGQLLHFVGVGGQAAYQYVITNGLGNAQVVPIANNMYEVVPSTGRVLAFDAQGNQIGSLTASTAVSLTDTQLQANIAGMSFDDAVAFAANAGYLVYTTDDGAGNAVATILDPVTNKLVAAISEEDN